MLNVWLHANCTAKLQLRNTLFMTWDRSNSLVPCSQRRLRPKVSIFDTQKFSPSDTWTENRAPIMYIGVHVNMFLCDVIHLFYTIQKYHIYTPDILSYIILHYQIIPTSHFLRFWLRFFAFLELPGQGWTAERQDGVRQRQDLAEFPGRSCRPLRGRVVSSGVTAKNLDVSKKRSTFPGLTFLPQIPWSWYKIDTRYTWYTWLTQSFKKVNMLICVFVVWSGQKPCLILFGPNDRKNPNARAWICKDRHSHLKDSDGHGKCASHRGTERRSSNYRAA